MASPTEIVKKRRKSRLRKAGRKRKNQMATKSTMSAEELFAALGEPGKPAPASSASAQSA